MTPASNTSFERLSGYLWLARRYGLRRTWRYERERRRRERLYGPFIPALHGEPLLRAIGATNEEIALAKREGLA